VKFGQKPPVIWHKAGEVKSSFYRLNAHVNRLLLLESLWENKTGGKSRFWRLYAVKGGVIYVKTAAPAARQELMLKEKELIRELNKNFDRPWIKQISAVQESFK
jgi:hypothetical protein